MESLEVERIRILFRTLNRTLISYQNSGTYVCFVQIKIKRKGGPRGTN